MAVRDEEAHIVRSLESVLNQSYPDDRYEVIVADGMSSDATRARVEEVRAALARAGRSVPLTVIDNVERIVASGLNRAIACSRGEVIIRVDGHSELASDYIQACLRALRTSGADNVGGVQVTQGATSLQRAIAAATSSRFGIGNSAFHYAKEPQWAESVPYGAFKRVVFERVGGFDEELVRNQDDELNLRIRQNGGKVWLDPAIRSTYTPRNSLRKLWRQYFQYGEFKVLVMQKRRVVPAARHLIPTLFVLACGLAIADATIRRRNTLPKLVLIPYGAANVAASIEAARSEPRILLRLPAVFATLHCAYGTGLLRGLWRFKRGFFEPPREAPKILSDR